MEVVQKLRWGTSEGGGEEIIQSWDTATKAEAKNDWSVCTTWMIRGRDYYLLNVFRQRLEFPELKRRIAQLANEWNADRVLIEDKGAGTSLIQELRRESDLSVIDFVPKDDKATRLMAITPAIEAGRVFLPKEAHWLAEFQQEMERFPRGRHDDQVDSLSQFLTWAKDHRGYGESRIYAPSGFFGSRDEMGSLLPRTEEEGPPGPPPRAAWDY